jgi:hypothetical protein
VTLDPGGQLSAEVEVDRRSVLMVKAIVGDGKPEDLLVSVVKDGWQDPVASAAAARRADGAGVGYLQLELPGAGHWVVRLSNASHSALTANVLVATVDLD